MTSITNRLASVRQQITAACMEAGRDPAEVRLLAVSKTQPVTAVEEAISAGQTDFGENYLQDAMQKIEVRPDANWHFIGSIQSKKTRDIAANFSWVHSLTSARIARRLSDQRDPERGKLNVLIQVNLSGEASKSGITALEASALVPEILLLENLNLQGFMTIPEAEANEITLRARFRALREIRDEAEKAHHVTLPHLSMGMTGDFPVAIAEGATWIRVGTAIFGPRQAMK